MKYSEMSRAGERRALTGIEKTCYGMAAFGEPPRRDYGFEAG